MKAEFLKLAGVKTEKAFYKKYPTEAAFFKAHPEAKKMIKKAQVGKVLPKPLIDMNDPEAPMFQNVNMPVTEDINFMNQVTEAKDQEYAPLSNKKSGDDFLTQASPYAGYAGQLIGGIKNLEAEKNARKSAEQWANVSGVVAKAAGLKPELRERRYVRPEDNILQPDQMFPSYGVGTNVLAKDGREIYKAQDGTNIEEDEYENELIDKYKGYANLSKEIESRGVPANQPIQAAPVEAKPTKSSKQIDENSARDNWVEKTGLSWAEAKRRGYTDGSFQGNVKLLNRLKSESVESILKSPVKKSTSSGNRTSSKSSDAVSKITKNQERALIEGRGPMSKEAADKLYQKNKANQSKKSPSQYYKQNAQLRQIEEPGFFDRTVELLAHPLEVYGHYAKYRELPAYGFSKGDGNLYDDVLGAKNPFYWGSKAVNAVDYASAGAYGKSAKEAMGALPAAQLLKTTKYIPMPKGIPQNATVRSAGRIGPSAAKRLPGRNVPVTRLPDGTLYYGQVARYDYGGEIQNTYAPDYLYDDLGYEPLDDSEQIKQYIRGGNIPQAQTGFETFMTGGGGQALTSLADYGTGNNAGGQIGGALGGAAGMYFGGPAGAMVGQTLGTAVGGMLDSNARKQKKAQEKTMRNLNSAAMSQGAMQLQNQFSGFMERGGQITNPQVIAKFGDYSMDDLLAPPHDADMLRAGGHLSKYTPPSQRAMEQYAMGGEVKTTWGGHAETMSHNPYLPGTGETIMFRGQSHDESDGNGNTGIGVKYGKGVHDSYTNYAEYGTQEADADVEVERGEPAMELQEPNGDTNLTVFGNLKIPNAYIPILGDEKAKGKKFKNYVAELSKQEKRQNQIIEKSTSILDALEFDTSFDKLKLASLQANIQGANMKLKEIADRKTNAASLQSAINDTAEEYGLDADALAKGKAKMDPNAFEEYAKYGKNIKRAQKGYVSKYGLVPWEGNKYGLKKRTASQFTAKEWDDVADKYGFKGKGNEEFQKFLMNHPEASKIIKTRHNILYGKNPETDSDLYDDMLGAGWAAPELLNIPPAATVPQNTDAPKKDTKKEKDATYEVIPYERNKLADIFNQILPFIRPTDQEELDPMQLAGEMYALSTNQLEPVQAQTYQPELGVPYDISFQDQLNANQADYRAAQRMVGYNPAAQAMLNAQKYEANSKVLGEQFRANQAMKDQVYSKNRDILNDADLKNLAIYDQQYQRQAEALSNTKATTQAALNSIASKYAQNKLENRTLGTYENLYNYRFDPSGRAINMNPLYQANMPNVYQQYRDAGYVPVLDDEGNIIKFEKRNEEETDVARRGGKTKKNYSQSSIVRAFK